MRLSPSPRNREDLVRWIDANWADTVNLECKGNTCSAALNIKATDNPLL